MLGEGSAPEQLVDAVDGEESCDVGTEAVGHCDPHSVGRHHLPTRNKSHRDENKTSKVCLLQHCITVRMHSSVCDDLLSPSVQ